MEHIIVDIILNPFLLLLVTVLTGVLFGKITYKNFKFGTSGVLFTGIFFGWSSEKLSISEIFRGTGITEKAIENIMAESNTVFSIIFSFSLIFFGASVGLLASKDIGTIIKKYGTKFIILGVLITFIGAAATFGATLLLNNSHYEVTGVYVGALTSSPGLGAAIETTQKQAEFYADNFISLETEVQQEILKIIDPATSINPVGMNELTMEQRNKFIFNSVASVGTGYAIGYPFGLIIVILSVNLLPVLLRIDIDEEKRKYNIEVTQSRDSGICQASVPAFNTISFTLVCAIGYLIGCLQFGVGDFGFLSLGNTGGILITALVMGYIGNIGKLDFRMDSKILNLIQELSVLFFLGVVGLKYGYQAIETFLGSGLTLAIASIIIGNVALLSGVFIGRYIFRLNWIILVGAICGGMTSTPGLGAAIDALSSNDPAASYGATYPFALIGMIFFTIALRTLPI